MGVLLLARLMNPRDPGGRAQHRSSAWRTRRGCCSSTSRTCRRCSSIAPTMRPTCGALRQRHSPKRRRHPAAAPPARIRVAAAFSASRRWRFRISSRWMSSAAASSTSLPPTELMTSPKLYATFLLWLLSELFEELPEIGDPEKPKLVFFFDEAHLLFDDAPKGLRDKIEQVVRLFDPRASASISSRRTRSTSPRRSPGSSATGCSMHCAPIRRATKGDQGGGRDVPDQSQAQAGRRDRHLRVEGRRGSRLGPSGGWIADAGRADPDQAASLAPGAADGAGAGGDPGGISPRRQV